MKLKINVQVEFDIGWYHFVKVHTIPMVFYVYISNPAGRYGRLVMIFARL